MEYVGELISVMAVFSGEQRCKPVKFRWAGRVVEVKDVTYRWTDWQGRSKVYHFSVTDGGTYYELGFNSVSMSWTLEKVETQVS
ncbi:MAG: hypothetical protein HQK89_07360 [Nitrospirae bacterium]|nr:hypothetical protein [Nitrospirota bacterium]